MMAAMPDVVTHRYNPAVGACLNICALPDSQASTVLDSLRRGFRPTLKPAYLERRRITEQWLAQAASQVLARPVEQTPAYFFLGDFSHLVDRSRPASLVVPLSILPPGSITFTLGDSMSVSEETARKIYTLHEMATMFGSGGVVAGFGVSDRDGFQERFIEVQIWDRSFISTCARKKIDT